MDHKADGEGDNDGIYTSELAESFAIMIKAANPSIDISMIDKKTMNVLAKKYTRFWRSLPKVCSSNFSQQVFVNGFNFSP